MPNHRCAAGLEKSHLVHEDGPEVARDRAADLRHMAAELRQGRAVLVSHVSDARRHREVGLPTRSGSSVERAPIIPNGRQFTRPTTAKSPPWG